MSLSIFLDTLLLKPLQLIFEVVFNYALIYIKDPGLSIIALSLAINFLVLPLYRQADAIQEEERQTEARLNHWVSHIKKTFHGDERTMMLQTYYRQNHYSPIYVLRSAVSLFLQIPFFIAAYRFLSNLDILQGASLGPIANLSVPDGLLHIGGLTINVLPCIMTAVNMISCSIFTKNASAKDKLQLYGMALFFLVFLYSSPAGLVFYWTLNNIFSLIKTIFYKLKNPKKVIAVLSFCLGLGVFAVSFLISFGSVKRKLFLILIAGGLCIAPFISTITKRFSRSAPDSDCDSGVDNHIFLHAVLLLATISGILIPSAVIKASPQEFLSIITFTNPLWYLAHSLTLAVGMFVLWLGVFYKLASPKSRRIYSTVLWIACGVGIMNYLLFGRNLGLISAALVYTNMPIYPLRSVLINLVSIAAVTGVFLLVYLKRKTIIPRIISAVTAAVVCMAILNCFSINRSIQQVDFSADSHRPHLTLSKSKPNVVVIMLDRGYNLFVPYIFEEAPELKEKFSGFTYFHNTTSFGSCTNIGSPGLYGGYEYTPLEMNKRDKEPLVEKHNEAVTVMPALFDTNDFDVTVFDPTYAGYSFIPTLSVYDNYPDIDAYVSMGAFTDEAMEQKSISDRNRNFFMHSIMKMAPLFLQSSIYSNGYYHSHSNEQVATSCSQATGYSMDFLRSFSVLQKLPEITDFSEKSSGSFFMMSNDTAHSPMLLSEPDYLPVFEVDNTEYDAAHADRFTLDGQSIPITTTDRMMHYHSNMASFKSLGRWFDVLRENGVYDNTRIIIVSDHGWPMKLRKDLIRGDGTHTTDDLLAFPALLMVKDFNETGFRQSEEFMTNADVPTLAMKGLIDDPVNPFTGKPINSSAKEADVLYIFGSDKWNAEENNGTTFLPDRWYTVHDNIWDINNWELITENAVLPE